jgi:hypothetical protein
MDEAEAAVVGADQQAAGDPPTLSGLRTLAYVL